MQESVFTPSGLGALKSKTGAGVISAAFGLGWGLAMTKEKEEKNEMIGRMTRLNLDCIALK